jgi:hypothetical protein
MKDKLKLLTLILTILFSFAVTSVVWAECIVEVFPTAAVVAPGDSLTFIAETTCDGVVQTAAFGAAPSYAWEISTSDCTGSASTIDGNGLYTAGDAGGCTETITATDTANGNATGEATVTVSDCDEDPVVTITPSSPACVAQEVCAATTLCGEEVAGTYTWTATGGIANTTSGECIPFTPSGAGSFTVTATDTANGNTRDSVAGNCITTTAIDAKFTGCGTPLILWFGVVEIRGTGTDFGLTSIVRYDSPLVFKLPKLLGIDKTTITQFVILSPSLFFPAWDYPATVTVSVDGLSDTIEIPACGQ